MNLCFSGTDADWLDPPIPNSYTIIQRFHNSPRFPALMLWPPKDDWRRHEHDKTNNFLRCSALDVPEDRDRCMDHRLGRARYRRARSHVRLPAIFQLLTSNDMVVALPKQLVCSCPDAGLLHVGPFDRRLRMDVTTSLSENTSNSRHVHWPRWHC